MKLFLRSVTKPLESTGVLENNRCTISSGLLCSSHYPRTRTVPKKQMSEREVKSKKASDVFSVLTYTGKKKAKKTPNRLGKKEITQDANFIPAEKLTTGKKRPSMLKFSNIPWTGWPFIRKEMLGALRSKQQLITSSVLNKCWLGEFTVRATQPMEVNETHSKISENYRFSQQPETKRQKT